MKHILLVFVVLLCYRNLPAQNVNNKAKVRVQSIETLNTVMTNTTYALIVGVSDYEDDKLRKLDYACIDAIKFYEFLKKGYTLKNVDTNNIKLDTNSKANYSNIIADLFIWLQGVKQTIKPGDDVFIYWSGHGMIAFDDQKLICKDTKIMDYANGNLSSAVGMIDIKSKVAEFALQNNDVRVFLIIDACRENMRPEGYDLSRIDHVQKLSKPGESYFYACGPGNNSYESKDLDKGTGVFTYFLLMGLQGAADRIPSDGIVTMAELKVFLINTVSAYVNKVISPNAGNPLFQDPEVKSANNAMSSFVLTKVPVEIIEQNKKTVDDLFISLYSQTSVSGTPIAPKGIKSLRYSKTIQVNEADTNWRVLYEKIMKQIEKGDLIDRSGNAAYGNYLRISSMYPDSLLNISIKAALFQRLVGDVKLFIEDYIDGKLTNTKKSTFENAREKLEKAIILLPGDTIFSKAMKPQLLFLKARSFAESNNPADWNRGIDLIDQAMKIKGGSAYLYHTKGVLFRNKNRFFSALKYFDSARVLAPRWKYLLYSMAVTYNKIQEYDKSLKLCNEVITLDSNYSAAYSCMGWGWEAIADRASSPDYTKAIDWNYRSLEKDSTNSRAYLNLGNIYYKKNNRDLSNRIKALEYYIQGSKLDNDDCLAALGQFYKEQGEKTFDSARYFYKRALDINPYNSNAVSQYLTLITKDSAEAFFSNLFLEAGNDYKLKTIYKNYIFKTKSSVVADSIFDAIIADNDEDPLIFIEHSKQFELIDSLVKARSILHKGIVAIHYSPSLNYALGQLYFSHSKNPLFKEFALDSAFYYLDKLRQYAPEYSIAYYNTYQVLLAQSKVDMAEIFLKNAIAHNRYAKFTNDFGRNLLSLGDTAVSLKKYEDAQNYYKLAASIFSDEKEKLMLKIMRTFYLDNKLDSATSYYNQVVIYLMNDSLTSLDSNYLSYADELMGLVEIDKRKNKSYRKANYIFKTLIGNPRDYKNVLEQAVSYYLLNNKKMAKSVAIANPENRADTFQSMLKLEGIEYSPFFIKKLKAMVEEIGSEFFTYPTKEAK